MDVQLGCVAMRYRVGWALNEYIRINLAICYCTESN